MDPKVTEVTSMVKDLVNKHRDHIHGCTLDWVVMEVSHPRYDSKLEYLVPIFDMQFK